VSQAFRHERQIRAARSEFVEAPHGVGALAARAFWQRHHAKAVRRLGRAIVANDVAEALDEPIGCQVDCDYCIGDRITSEDPGGRWRA
jgi:sulfatase maturation enzyme AslB (radical SAM superfamily)